MKRRLLDRFVLMECKLVSENFVLGPPVPPPEKGASETLAVELVVKLEHGHAEPPPDGAKQAILGTVELDARVSRKSQPEPPVYTATVRIAGLFLLTSGEPVGLPEMEQDRHSITRMLYPVARSYLWLLLARARVPDLPMPWDVGPDSAGAASSADSEPKVAAQ